MTWDEAIGILFTERVVQVDAGVFADPPAPTGVYIPGEVRFGKNKWGQVNSGWADILGDAIFVTPNGGEGRYVPIACVRREESYAQAGHPATDEV
jgi:hypothetical protein